MAFSFDSEQVGLKGLRCFERISLLDRPQAMGDYHHHFFVSRELSALLGFAVFTACIYCCT